MYYFDIFSSFSHIGKLETGRKKKSSASLPSRRSRSMVINNRLCVPNQLLDKLKNATPILVSFKENSLKRNLHESLDKATDALEDFDLQPPRKRPALVRHAPAALTVYVRKEEDRIYDAVRLYSSSLDGLKQAIAEKYGLPSNMISSISLRRQKEGETLIMEDETVQSLEDEDSFIIDLHFDNKSGNFDVTLCSTEI